MNPTYSPKDTHELTIWWSNNQRESLRKQGYGWIIPYEEDIVQKDIPTIFHATHLSNVTSIRYDGLKPFKHLEEDGNGNVFVVASPFSAIQHISGGGQHDTYRLGQKELMDPDALDYPSIDTETRMKNDPPVLLKIDYVGLINDHIVEDKEKAAIDKRWATHVDKLRKGYINQDLSGTRIGRTIPPKYIKAVIHDKEGKIHELSLDDLIDKVLIKNEIGIEPDFL